MGKIHVDHRIVVRDADDRIISDQYFESYVEARPVFEAGKKTVPDGYSIALQHGARVVEWFSGSD